MELTASLNTRAAPLTQLLQTARSSFARIHMPAHLTRCEPEAIGSEGMQKIIKAKLNTDINWNTTVFMIIFHVGAVAALFFFSWKAIVMSLVLAWIAGSLGIGMGFHRLLTHRGFKTPKLVEYFLTVCGTLTLEGGAINWVVTHRIHHAHTEQPGDPHSP